MIATPQERSIRKLEMALFDDFLELAHVQVNLFSEFLWSTRARHIAHVANGGAHSLVFEGLTERFAQDTDDRVWCTHWGHETIPAVVAESWQDRFIESWQIRHGSPSVFVGGGQAQHQVTVHEGLGTCHEHQLYAARRDFHGCC